MAPTLSLQEKISKLIEDNGVSVRQFAISVDIDPSYLGKFLKGKVGLTLEKLELIADKYKVDIGWLREKNMDNVPQETSMFEEPTQTYIQKRNHQKQTSNIYMVPFVDVPAQAGYTKAYSNVDYIQTLKMYPILPDIDPTGAVWRYFQVQGDSMEDEIREKDVLLASLVPQMDWLDIKDYHTYIIITDEELLIKDILKETEETIILLSQNPKYKARRIKLEEVKQIWVMRRHIKNRAKKSRMYNLDEIKKELKK